MSLLQHLQECAEEEGVDLYECHSNEEKIQHRGHIIEVSYNDSRCTWESFVLGFGTFTSPWNREEVVTRAMAAISPDQGHPTT